MDAHVALLRLTEAVSWLGLGVLARGGWTLVSHRLRHGWWPIARSHRIRLAFGGTSYGLFCVALLDLLRFRTLSEAWMVAIVLGIGVTGAVASWLTTRWVATAVNGKENP